MSRKRARARLLTMAAAVVSALAMIAPTPAYAAGTGMPNDPYTSRPLAESWTVPTPYTQYSFQDFDWDGNLGAVDNPINLIFVSNKPDVVGRVYRQLDAYAGMAKGDFGVMTVRGNGPSGPNDTSNEWTSSSKGHKTGRGCGGTCGANSDVHVRLYGHNSTVSTTQVYQTISAFHYYAVGIVHVDINDFDPHSGKKEYGYQNRARDWLVNQMEVVHKNEWKPYGQVELDNACSFREEDANTIHTCDHNGYALRIYIDDSHTQ